MFAAPSFTDGAVLSLKDQQTDAIAERLMEHVNEQAVASECLKNGDLP